MKNFNLQPVGKKIIVKRLKVQEKIQNGLIIPLSAKREEDIYEVVASENPDIPIETILIISKYGHQTIVVDDQEYQVLKEDDIIAKVNISATHKSL